MENKTYNMKHIAHNRGFTLIELMVSISIFMIIMLIALGSILVSSGASSKAQAFRTSMDNVNFAVESMTRSLRMGTHYTCGLDTYNETSGKDCENGDDSISFKSSNGENISYKLNGNKLERCIEGLECVPLVSKNVNIEELEFFVNGASNIDNILQPSTYIVIKGTVNIKAEPFSFAIQTMASQRNLE